MREEVAMLLEAAREAREGRDRWRQVRPILIELRTAGVSLREIQAATGIHPATASRIAPIPTRTGGSSPSGTTSRSTPATDSHGENRQTGHPPARTVTPKPNSN